MKSCNEKLKMVVIVKYLLLYFLSCFYDDKLIGENRESKLKITKIKGEFYSFK